MNDPLQPCDPRISKTTPKLPSAEEYAHEIISGNIRGNGVTVQLQNYARAVLEAAAQHLESKQGKSWAADEIRKLKDKC